MKALVLCVYFDRPKMVLNALESVRDQTSSAWTLGFIDDGSTVPGVPIMESVVGFRPHSLSITGMDSVEQKIAQGGSRHGQYMNDLIHASDDDLVIVLCDDDALHPECVANCINWFTENPDKLWGYGHIQDFNPHKEKPGAVVRGSDYNQHTGPVDPVCRLDSTQVVFRREVFDKCSYPFPATGALDADVFAHVMAITDKVEYMGFVTQYKGRFPGQMGNRADPFAPDDLA